MAISALSLIPVRASRLFAVFALLCVFASLCLIPHSHAEEIVIKPKEYPRALRNPLMGFRPDWSRNNPGFDWGTLARHYIKWNDIENHETDGIEKIRAFCDEKWRGAAEQNVKIIPRVYLHWSKDDQKYWPADLETVVYASVKFKRRLVPVAARRFLDSPRQTL
jgi:hypothetical protein